MDAKVKFRSLHGKLLWTVKEFKILMISPPRMVIVLKSFSNVEHIFKIDLYISKTTTLWLSEFDFEIDLSQNIHKNII